jgi:hypothetical protein
VFEEAKDSGEYREQMTQERAGISLARAQNGALQKRA